MSPIIYDGNAYDTTDRSSDKFICVNSCGISNPHPYHTVRRKGRKDYLLLYVEKGELIAQVDGEERHVPEGGFIIYPCFVPHDYMQYNGTCFWVHFTGRFVGELLTASGLEGIHCADTGSVDPYVIQRFERLILNSVKLNSNTELQLAIDLSSLLLRLGNNLNQTRTSIADDRIRSVVLHMHKHYHEQVSIDEYADMCGLSAGHFAHLFRKETGQSPHAYLLTLRLQTADEYLLSTDKSISEIAYAVGFTDPLYFSRLFKKHRKTSPAEFRRAQRA